MSTSALSKDESWKISIMKRKKKKSTEQKYHGPPKEVDDVCILYYLVCGFMLFMGVTLIAVSITSFLKKLPYYVLLEIKIDMPYFILPAGILTLPCVWIIFLMHRRVIYRIKLLHILTTLQLIIVGLLITGISIGMMYVSKLDQIKCNFTTSLDLLELNAALQVALLKVPADNSTRDAWYTTQSHLECCGILTYRDWIKIKQEIPSSCCREVICTEENVYVTGCLDALSVDLQWQNNFLSSHCIMGSVVHIVASLCTVAIYVIYKVTSK